MDDLTEMTKFVIDYGNLDDKKELYKSIAETVIYPVNTFVDLQNIPESVIESINSYRLIFPRTKFEVLEKELNKFSQEFFHESIHLDEIKNMKSHKYSYFQYLGEEQKKYMFGIKTIGRDNENKNDLLQRLSNSLPLDKNCKSWFIMVTLNSVPYGGIFIFQQKDNPNDVMIQGISKFTIPGLFSILRPNLSKQLPRLNSLLMPEIERLAQSIGATRIIVNPVGSQGRILEKHYGFYPIDSIENPCEKIMESLEDNFLAKEIN